MAATSHLPDNILLVDKPIGMTSFDVIRQLRRQTGLRKFGHAGTLDPAASGLMLIGVGPGTKTLQELTKLDKTYEAEILLGQRRHTSDMDGEVVAQVDIPPGTISSDTVREAVGELQGTQTLPVSAYSAIKQDGVPMYKRARAAAKAGTSVSDVPVRAMEVYKATLHTVEDSVQDGRPCVRVRVCFHVGSGTYIRSLAEELGATLGYPAVLSALRRTHVGPYDVADAVPPADIQTIQIKE